MAKLIIKALIIEQKQNKLVRAKYLNKYSKKEKKFILNLFLTLSLLQKHVFLSHYLKILFSFPIIYWVFFSSYYYTKRFFLLIHFFYN